MITETPHRVLVVDDDADIRANIADILNDLGYDVTMASDGSSALQCVRAGNFDVVLLDYKMPGIDGATLYREIKRIRPSIAAIMVTAYAGSDGIKQAIEAGTWDVLQKPVNIAELLTKVEHAVQAPLILVVDDDESFCQSLWQILNERHYRVALAHNEFDGVSQINERRHQIVLVDVKLGASHGRSVIQRIAESDIKTSTILISGHHDEIDAILSEFGSHGVQAVCVKPINIDFLLGSVPKRLERGFSGSVGCTPS